MFGDSGGYSNFFEEFAQQQCGHRCLFCGFQYDGVACGDSRCDFPCGHKQGNVPGDDWCAYADGFSEGPAVELGFG